MDQRNPRSFKLDLNEVRRQARVDVDQGAVTPAYRGDRERVIEILNGALATELVCNLRYRRHYFMVSATAGIPGFAIADEFLEHANQEQAHADMIAERIVQLGGEPDFDPKGMTDRSHAEYVAGKDIQSMLHEDLIAERIAIQTYAEIIRYIGDTDPTTRRIMEQILAQEEEHADDLADFMKRIPASATPNR
ncbi:MAG: ferritin-like domain-containing protein [Polyangiaceae bacterium]